MLEYKDGEPSIARKRKSLIIHCTKNKQDPKETTWCQDEWECEYTTAIKSMVNATITRKYWSADIPLP
jgi:hypothetical protein